LAAGSVTGIVVKNMNTGCVSSPALCSASDCGSHLKASTSPNTGIVTDANARTGTETSPAKTTVASRSVETITARIASNANALASPNPFSDKIQFTLQSATSGRGTLELYNMMGQKVKTVFEGNVQAGKSRNIEYFVPVSQRTNLTWVFTVGDQKVSGKLIGIK
jgi:hypothetical protein